MRFVIGNYNNEECSSVPGYIPLPRADAKWTMKLQSVDNGPIEIQQTNT